MTAILTVTSKNQVTFPVELMSRLKVAKGDRLLLRVKGKAVQIEKVEGLRSLQGLLASTKVGKKLTLEEVIEKAKKREVKRLVNED